MAKKTASRSRRAARSKITRPKAAPPPKAVAWIAKELRPLAVPVDKLQLDPKNARTHDEDNIAAIAASLNRYGQVKPIVVNRRNGQVAAGNGTLAAARSLGHTHIAAVLVDHDEASQHGFAVADNRTAELAGWDEEMLASLLADYGEDMGEELSEALLFDALGDVEESPDDDPPIVPEAVNIETSYQVLVKLATEEDQEALYERLTAEGFECRTLTVEAEADGQEEDE